MQTIAKKAFTLVEVMIIVVIIGLLAAMAVPAYTKVKTNSIAKEVILGHSITEDQKEYLITHANLINDEFASRLSMPGKPAPVPIQPVAVETYQSIVLNGKTYKLVPQ